MEGTGEVNCITCKNKKQLKPPRANRINLRFFLKENLKRFSDKKKTSLIYTLICLLIGSNRKIRIQSLVK